MIRLTLLILYLGSCTSALDCLMESKDQYHFRYRIDLITISGASFSPSLVSHSVVSVKFQIKPHSFNPVLRKYSRCTLHYLKPPSILVLSSQTLRRHYLKFQLSPNSKNVQHPSRSASQQPLLPTTNPKPPPLDGQPSLNPYFLLIRIRPLHLMPLLL
jgi:hypothetical protein